MNEIGWTFGNIGRIQLACIKKKQEETSFNSEIRRFKFKTEVLCNPFNFAKMYEKILVIIFLVTNFQLCQSRKYTNYSLYNVMPVELDHLKFLQNLVTQKYVDMLFWKKPYKLYEDVQFIVSPQDRSLFLERARHFRTDVTLQLENVQA